MKIRSIALFFILFLGIDVALSSEPVKLDSQTLQRCHQILRDALRSDEFWPSMHAAEGLTLAGFGEEVREWLDDQLLNEKDDQKRCGLARELVRAGDRDRSRVMLGILRSPITHGHVHAAESLYKVGWVGDDAPIQNAFSDSADVRLRLMAAAALARHTTGPSRTQALAFIRNHLRSEADPAMFRLSAWILARLGTEDDRELIRSRLSESKDELVRAFLYHALAALGDPQGQRELLKNLRSEDPAIRTYAAVFAGESDMQTSIPFLIQQLDDPHRDARVRAAQALIVLSRS